MINLFTKIFSAASTDSRDESSSPISCTEDHRELIRNSKKDRRLTGPPATFYLKILVVGAPGVGKSSIIRRYCGEETLMDYEPTIGVEWKSTIVPHDLTQRFGMDFRIRFCEIPFQEIRSGRARRLLRELHGCIFVFDATDASTIPAVDAFRALIEKELIETGEVVPLVLCANKRDKGRSVIDPRGMDAYIQKCGYISWHSISARQDHDDAAIRDMVNFMRDTLLDRVYTRYKGVPPTYLEKLRNHADHQQPTLYSRGKRSSRPSSLQVNAEICDEILDGSLFVQQTKDLESSVSSTFSPNENTVANVERQSAADRLAEVWLLEEILSSTQSAADDIYLDSSLRSDG